MYDLLAAIEEIIRSADSEKKKALAAALDRYIEENAHDFFWATGPQAPALLHHIMMSIDLSCRPGDEQMSARIFRLIDRKPEH
jgi:hypothetical protein